MAELYIAGTFVGALFVLILAFWINSRRTRHSKFLKSERLKQDNGLEHLVKKIVSSPVSWMVAFIAVVSVALAAAIGVLTGLLEFEGGAWMAVTLIFGTLFSGFIIYNVYAVARNRGHSSALSIGESLAVLVLILFVGVAAMLIMA